MIMKKRELFFLIVLICLGCVIPSCDIAEPKSASPLPANTQQERKATPTFQENQEDLRIRLADEMKLVFVPGGDFLDGQR